MTYEERVQQARDWRANGWDIYAIADELDVTQDTVRRYLDDDRRKAYVARLAAWRTGPGKEKQRMIALRYRAKVRERTALRDGSTAS